VDEGRKMKGVSAFRSGLGFVGVMLVVLALVMPTVIAYKNEWHISINNANVPYGYSCLATVTGINDHVVGTVTWDTDYDPGFTWYYSYDNGLHKYGVSAGWSEPYITFNFYANDHGYRWGNQFEITSYDASGPYKYYCLL
jgi:hypothetical protein